MISAGNDIVSLTATNVTRTKSPEFYSKIISPAEQALFDTLDHAILPFDRFVWLLWSVKESAYKFLYRLDPTIVFTPVKFEVQSIEIPPGYTSSPGADQLTGCGFSGIDILSAEVVFDNKKLFSRIIINDAFVSAVVNQADYFGDIYWGIRQIDDISYKFQSAAVRIFVLNILRGLPGMQDILIGKNEANIPVLLRNNKILATPVSLSHHDRWIAFSFRSLVTTGS